MATTTVGPGELGSALSAAKAGDTLVVHGNQPGTNTTLGKTVTLEGGGDETVLGRLILNGAGVVLHKLRLNGKGGPSNGPASWTVSGNGCQILGCDLTNEHLAIGVNTYNGGDDLTVQGCHFHDGGKIATSAAGFSASDQPYQHKDGSWSGNHHHAIYLTGKRGIVRENIIERWSDRAVQLRGSSSTVVERNLGLDCGMGLMFGDLNDSFDASHLNLWLDNQIVKRALIESYQPGQSDSAADWAWNSDGRQAIAAAGVNTLACKTGDPHFDRATMRLLASSPAVGYGPTRIQPDVAPPPPPPPPIVDVPGALADIEAALAHWRLTTLGYAAARKANPNVFPQTQNGQAEALIQSAIVKLGG